MVLFCPIFRVSRKVNIPFLKISIPLLMVCVYLALCCVLRLVDENKLPNIIIV